MSDEFNRRIARAQQAGRLSDNIPEAMMPPEPIFQIAFQDESYTFLGIVHKLPHSIPIFLPGGTLSELQESPVVLGSMLEASQMISLYSKYSDQFNFAIKELNAAKNMLGNHYEQLKSMYGVFDPYSETGVRFDPTPRPPSAHLA